MYFKRESETLAEGCFVGKKGAPFVKLDAAGFFVMALMMVLTSHPRAATAGGERRLLDVRPAAVSTPSRRKRGQKE